MNNAIKQWTMQLNNEQRLEQTSQEDKMASKHTERCSTLLLRITDAKTAMDTCQHIPPLEWLKSETPNTPPNAG